MAPVTSSQTEHRRIARNTFYLYLRMIIIMGITLYTSRVVLNVLGIDDFGIYNIVGSLVVLFSFLSGSITGATQRYLCIAIGHNDKNETAQVFSSSLTAILLLSGVIVLVGETIGLWFIAHKLSFPPGRQGVAMAVYQISILTTVINLLRMPYQAAIISHERMEFFAWSSMLEAALKLGILFPLFYISQDKLLIYAWLMCGISIVLMVVYLFYVCSRYSEFRFRFGRSCLEEILSFTGWSSFGSLAIIGSRQGMNVILNLFFGVAVNAAFGVMNQVTNAVYSFIQNFLTAINPPLTKHYAADEMEEVRTMLFSASRLSYLLLLVLSMPLIFYMESILSLWLTDIPPYAAGFCIMGLLALYFNTFGGPVWTIMQATGHIRRYQIYISTLTLLTLPAMWITLKCGLIPWMVLVPTVTVNIAVVYVGLNMISGYIDASPGRYTLKVILPCLLTTLLVALLMWILSMIDIFSMLHSWAWLIPTLTVAYAVSLTTVYAVGLNSSERRLIKNLIKSKVNKS